MSLRWPSDKLRGILQKTSLFEGDKIISASFESKRTEIQSKTEGNEETQKTRLLDLS